MEGKEEIMEMLKESMPPEVRKMLENSNAEVQIISLEGPEEMEGAEEVEEAEEMRSGMVCSKCGCDMREGPSAGPLGGNFLDRVKGAVNRARREG